MTAPLRAAALLSLALTSTAFARDRQGPPYADLSRSTEEQAEAAEKAAKEAASADPSRAITLLADPSAAVRDAVFEALASRNDTGLLGALRQHLGHPDPFVRAAIAELFGRCRYAEGRAALEKLGLGARDADTVLESIWALEALGSPESAKALERIATKGHRAAPGRAAGDALLALAAAAPDRARALAPDALESAEPERRMAALEVLSRLDAREGARAACSALRGEPPLPKKAAARATALLRCAFQVLARWRARTADPALAREAVTSLLAALPGTTGLERALCERALAAATGEALSGTAWQDWWQARGAAWQPRDLAAPEANGAQDDDDEEGKSKKKKKDKKKKGKKKKDEDDEDDAPAPSPNPNPSPNPGGGPGRVVTGDASATKVRFCGVPVESRRILFLQDTSGGMSRHPVDEDAAESPLRIDYSRRELTRVLEQLPDDAEVNVLFFATRYRSISPRLVPVGARRKDLISYVARECKTPEGKGLTRSNLYDALLFALDDPAIDSVFFLSEGGQTEGRYVGEERLLFHLERLERYRRVQVNCLQVTTKKGRARFLQELARRTGGTYYPRSFLAK
ncbi:MAG: HEAT repeat domain-containing protein [Planctomycetota bacterium]